MNSIENNLEITKKLVKSILMPHKNGLIIKDLQKNFFLMENKFIPYKACGFNDIISYLNSMPEAFNIEHLITGKIVVKAKAEEKDAHIAKMVENQITKASSESEETKKTLQEDKWIQYQISLTNMPDLLTNLISIISENRQGIEPRDLELLFEKRFHNKLDSKKYGYNSTIELIIYFRNVFKVKYFYGKELIFLLNENDKCYVHPKSIRPEFRPHRRNDLQNYAITIKFSTYLTSIGKDTNLPNSSIPEKVINKFEFIQKIDEKYTDPLIEKNKHFNISSDKNAKIFIHQIKLSENEDIIHIIDIKNKAYVTSIDISHLINRWPNDILIKMLKLFGISKPIININKNTDEFVFEKMIKFGFEKCENFALFCLCDVAELVQHFRPKIDSKILEALEFQTKKFANIC